MVGPRSIHPGPRNPPIPVRGTDINESIRLGRIAGIPVGLNWSLILIAGLISWNLATVLLPDAVDGYSDGAYWLVSLVAAVAFFASILAHELSHAIVAQRRGIEVSGITLWLLGGVAKLGSAPKKAGDEFRIAAAGPAMSLVVGAVSFGLAFGLDALGASPLLVAALGWLALINGVLAVFNLIPAAPLDGGRILSAALWHRHGDRSRALRSAASAGRFFGTLLMVGGVAQIVFDAGFGWWTIAIGWFLRSAATAEARGADMAGLVESVSVGDTMSPFADSLEDWMTVDEALAAHPGEGSQSLAVYDFNRHFLGFVTTREMRRIPPPERPDTRVRDLARPLDSLLQVTSRRPLVTVISELRQRDERHALVVDAGTISGLLTWSDIDAALRGETARVRP